MHNVLFFGKKLFYLYIIPWENSLLSLLFLDSLASWTGTCRTLQICRKESIGKTLQL